MSMNSFHSRGHRARPAPHTAATAPVREGLMRADVLLVRLGLAASRTQAREAIAAGRVRLGQETLGKASQLLPLDARPELTPDAG
jgi:23S rRNA (cytidine1920-2'-O)/16S rRNA (cytidine1409-2'-O)-methyltransferase